MPCSSQFQLFINAKYRTFLLSNPVLVIQKNTKEHSTGRNLTEYIKNLREKQLAKTEK